MKILFVIFLGLIIGSNTICSAMNMVHDTDSELIEFPMESEGESQESVDEEKGKEFYDELDTPGLNLDATIGNQSSLDDILLSHHYKEVHIPPPDFI